MVKSGVGEFQCNGVDSENVLDRSACLAIRSGTIAHPEQVARAIPNAVARAFEHQMARELCNGVDETARLQGPKTALERFLLAAALRMTETRQHRLAVEHDRSIRREYQIREVRRRRHQLDGGAETGKRPMERRPFPPRGIDQNLAFARPARWVHPRVDDVVDREMIGPTHQKARIR